MCHINKERFVFLWNGFSIYYVGLLIVSSQLPSVISHSSWRVRWQTLLNRLSSHAAAAGPLPVCLWLSSWWHCRLPGKVEGHSCLFSFKLSMSPCYSQIFLGVGNPQSIQWPTGLLCCADSTPHPAEESWAGVTALQPAVPGLNKRLYHLIAISPWAWTLELSRKHTAHAGFRHWGFCLLVFICVW